MARPIANDGSTPMNHSRTERIIFLGIKSKQDPVQGPELRGVSIPFRVEKTRIMLSQSKVEMRFSMRHDKRDVAGGS
jgi:hypothetical protein